MTDAITAAAIAGNVPDDKAREIIEAYFAAEAANQPPATRKITREDLEFQSGQLVKIGGMRPQYMDGYRLIDAVRSIAKLLLAAESADEERMAWEATTPCYVRFVSDARYRKFSPEVQCWYKPIGSASFQSRVQPWMQACFGPEISADRVERCDRFIEEALELTQAIGYSADRAHALVDYVFGREVGDPHQEVGGVMVTLAALCLACDLDIDRAAEDELARIWTKVDAIRAKQAAKPTGSALPSAPILANSTGDHHG